MNKIILLILIFIIGLTSQVSFANTFTVTNNADNGSGSLRDAITNVLLNDGDIIQFDHDYTINLTSGELAIGKSITIDGYNHKVTVSGTGISRVFNVNSGVTVTLKNLTIQNGNADNGGGIFSDGSLTIYNCTITGNAATNNGGGIYINSGTVTINNSTLSANSAQSGGGIFNNSNVVINNSTLSGNNGGGIYNNGTLELKNTIIANSTGGDCNNTTNGSIINTSINNLIQNGSCNLTLSGDPKLGPLDIINGGLTPTHALLDGSIAIGAGDPATCLLEDQRGKTRDSPCDIGAFEFNHAPVANDATFITTINTNLSNPLSATDSDGDSLTYSIVNSSSLGTVTLTDSTTGAFTYTPPSNQTGIANFTYEVIDNAFDSKKSAVKTVTIKIVNNIVVDNAGDNVSAGQNTLREAITHALSGDMITFANSLANQTITIDKKNGPLVINKNLIIDGAGQNITLSGGNNTRLFQIDGGTITLNHLTLSEGKSEDGGAIHVNNGATLSLNDCTVFNNQTIGKSHRGGGLFIDTGAIVEINRCLIDSNTSNGNEYGGGIFNRGQLTLNNSTITNNDANNGGGGLYNESGARAEINNSTFSANSTAQKDQGSNLRNGGTLKLRNTILANSGKNGGDCTNAGTIDPNLNNLIEDGTCSSTTNLKGDPKLIGLQANGTFALSDGSPAIDAGDNSTCLATDQLGKLRPIGGNCDIGAVEKDSGVVPQLDAAAPSVISTDPTDTATGIDPTAVVTINFSESVNATVSSFSLECPAGTAIPFNLSASPATTFTLTPTSNLPSGTSCQVIVNQISDVDNIDPPDNLSGNDRFSFQTVNPPPPQPTPTKPSPPTNLQAVPIVATETMELSWNDNSDNETGFKIARDGNLLSTTAADTTTYQDSPLKCGTEYTYSVTAINTVGESAAATITVSTWNCPTIPSPPTNLQAVPIVATQTMGLSWSDNSDNETGFKIARDGETLLTTAANITTYQDSPLKCGTEYTYSVIAINTVEESSAATITVSTWDCPTPPPIIVVGPDPLVPPTDNTTTPPTTDQPPTTVAQPPIAPIKLNVVATSPTEVTLTWNDTSHNETGFKIERNNSLTQITAANITTYKDTELTCNTTYNYTIKATNASGDSATLTASITTPMCATKPLVPSNLKVIATSPTAVNLSWTDNSDNETGFKIERDGTVVHISLATVTSYQDNGLTCGTSYHYQVIATNATGDSAALTQTITTLPCTSIDSLPSTPMSLEISFIGDGQAQIKTYAAEIACDSSKAICTHDVKVPTTVILVATAAKGSQFLAWEGDCQSKSDSIEFILNTNRHCIAHFDKVADVPKDNTNNTSDSKDVEPCLVDNSLNCNHLPPVNHLPTDIILSNQRLDENSPGGTFIGRLTTLDLDVNEAHQYTLLDDASHTFILQSGELHLAQHAQLDFETAPSYTILVRSTDSQGTFLDKMFTIGVNDTEEAQFLGKVLTADWQVGKDMTIDEPEIVNLIGYIKPQATHIGQLADIIAIYDWTPAQESQLALSIPITITHQTLLQTDMQISLYEGRLIGLAGILKITLGYQLNHGENIAGQIINLNINPNRPPADIYLSNHTVMENSQPNTVIGWLATTDLDQQDQFTYGLIDNPGNYFTIVGNELRVNHFHFNYANGAIYPIQVRSVDMTGAYVDKSFTIEITDTQSPLKDIQLTKTAVFENSPKGFIIGRLWIRGDEQSHYQYELIENAQGRFTLMNDLIVIAKDDELDFENQVAYPIVVRSTQTDTHQVLEKTFTIDILNVVDVTVQGELYDVTHQPIDFSNLRSADEVIIELQLIPDQTHQGQLADLFSVALWIADSGQTRIYMFNGDIWVEWNGDWATLGSVQPLILQAHHELILWQDKLPNFSSGQFYIFGGYRLKNGEVVYSLKPFDISIP